MMKVIYEIVGSELTGHTVKLIVWLFSFFRNKKEE
jgi:hypothetical protein